MRIERCYFCAGPIYPGHGTAFVRNDCKVIFHINSKIAGFFLKNKYLYIPAYECISDL